MSAFLLDSHFWERWCSQEASRPGACGAKLVYSSEQRSLLHRSVQSRRTQFESNPAPPPFFSHCSTPTLQRNPPLAPPPPTAPSMNPRKTTMTGSCAATDQAGSRAHGGAPAPTPRQDDHPVGGRATRGQERPAALVHGPAVRPVSGDIQRPGICAAARAACLTPGRVRTAVRARPQTSLQQRFPQVFEGEQFRAAGGGSEGVRATATSAL